ncbi:MAG: hypothetical protein JRM80_01665 [Nitrososphaerota archaeon]|nr:hypothetical protein [Nitrososphaerota archaeon]
MNNKIRKSVVDERRSYCPPTSLTDLVKVYWKSDLGDDIEVMVDPDSKTDPTAQRDIEASARKSGKMVVQSAGEKKFVRLVMKVTKKPTIFQPSNRAARTQGGKPPARSGNPGKGTRCREWKQSC